VDFELLVDVLEVLAHGARGDPEGLCDLGIGVSRCHEVENLGLALGESRSLSLLLEAQRALTSSTHGHDDDD
jgi:hypothetical protein